MDIIIRPWKHSSLKDAAVAYASEGHRVFPVSPNGKAPRLPKPKPGDPELRLASWQDPTKGGFHSAVDDADYLTALWTTVAAGSNVGFGIPPGTVVLDFDDRGGESALLKLAEEYPELAQELNESRTFRVQTPSGQHFYFRTDSDVIGSNANGGSYSGVRRVVDVKVGGKNYVLLPPSRKPGKAQYQHVSGDLSELEELSPGWVAALLDSTPGSSQRPRERIQLAPATFTTYEPAGLPGRVLPRGTARHPILFREACHLRERGYEVEEILGALAPLNRRLFEIPKPEADLVHLAADVCGRYPAGDVEAEPDDFTESKLYQHLAGMCGSAESLDYILDAVCAPGETAPRRVICLTGDPSACTQLLTAIEKGFEHGQVAHLPYSTLMPGAIHTRRTEHLAHVEASRLLVFAGGNRDPRFDPATWVRFANRGIVHYTRKGESRTAGIVGATVVHVYGQPANVKDSRMQAHSAVFPLAVPEGDPVILTQKRCSNLIRYAREIHDPGRTMPDANQQSTAYHFPIEPYDEAARELTFQDEFVDDRDAILAMVQEKFEQMGPSLVKPRKETMPAKLGLVSRNTCVEGVDVRGYKCKTSGRWAKLRQANDRQTTGEKGGLDQCL